MSSISAAGERIDPRRVRRLLVDLVSAYSPSFAEESATRRLEQALVEAGLPVRRQPVGAPAAGPRDNLIVDVGEGPPALLWVGHVDTIALLPGQAPEARVDGDMLWGLGSCDAKGACAAVVEALIALREAGVTLRQGLRVALLVGEEEEGDGAEALACEPLPPLTLIGEPTGLAPCLSCHGFLELSLRAEGSRAHAALPELGDNAAHAMLDWVGGVLEAAREIDDAAVSLRRISGGGRAFVVAESCEARLDVHLAPPHAAGAVMALVETMIERAAERHPGCAFSIEQEYWAPGYALDPDDPGPAAVARLCAASGRRVEPGGFRSHSDANLLFERGTRPVVLGPGELAVAHTPREHLALGELERAALLYAEIFGAICGES